MLPTRTWYTNQVVVLTSVPFSAYFYRAVVGDNAYMKDTNVGNIL
jgi:hypothetical protein